MGAVAGAHYIRSVAPAYEIPVILHTDHCAKKLLPWLDGMLVVRVDIKSRARRGLTILFTARQETLRRARRTSLQLSHDRSFGRVGRLEH